MRNQEVVSTKPYFVEGILLKAVGIERSAVFSPFTGPPQKARRHKLGFRV